MRFFHSGRHIQARSWAVLLSVVLLLSIGIGALQATAARHSHKLKVIYRSASKVIGSGDVQFVTANCPAGYRAIAASGDTDTIAYSNGYELDRISATSWWINPNGAIPGAVRAKVTCLKTRTSRVRTSSVGAQRRARERKLEALRASRAK
jgi:hypothetical protein